MSMRRYEFEFKGRTSLIMHADDVDRSDLVAKWRKDSKNKSTPNGDDRWPAWTWSAYVYVDPVSGKVAMPQENVMASIRDAAARVTMKKQETFKKVSQSGIVIDTPYCEFLGPRGSIDFSGVLKWPLDMPFQKQVERAGDLGITLLVKRAGINKDTKHVRVRPLFATWTVRGSLAVTEEVITTEKLQEIMKIAGSWSGIGDWRPSSPKKPGPFGQFAVSVKPI